MHLLIQVVEAFKILTSDKQVKAILVNIFGALPWTFHNLMWREIVRYRTTCCQCLVLAYV